MKRTTRQVAWLLVAAVVGMGLHSTLFGPVKYAYLPQQLKPEELIGGKNSARAVLLQNKVSNPNRNIFICCGILCNNAF